LEAKAVRNAGLIDAGSASRFDCAAGKLLGAGARLDEALGEIEPVTSGTFTAVAGSKIEELRPIELVESASAAAGAAGCGSSGVAAGAVAGAGAGVSAGQFGAVARDGILGTTRLCDWSFGGSVVGLGD
jgi:hypothetical protein